VLFWRLCADHGGGLEDAERRRQRWEQRRGARKGRRVHQRSVTTEKWVETLVVADHKMVEYHGSQGVEGYVLAIMNIVSTNITSESPYTSTESLARSPCWLPH